MFFVCLSKRTGQYSIFSHRLGSHNITESFLDYSNLHGSAPRSYHLPPLRTCQTPGLSAAPESMLRSQDGKNVSESTTHPLHYTSKVYRSALSIGTSPIAAIWVQLFIFSLLGMALHSRLNIALRILDLDQLQIASTPTPDLFQASEWDALR
ncbi:uncharacterized protein BJ212DRAFT_1482575 [Suillus subaureus]|uniref:Uncharacterized protein n=1 Tax=Suillus subaureus TaxID=48587 RepID=A0A9P7JC61_9AGAM|nr:uncharacterized protein BJ212DRAFT_1482575 [Suillus subaureus]KAG1813678.1 hypothetical protein BJ212DRAFT_1482575 [Suillus subaureus]